LLRVFQPEAVEDHLRVALIRSGDSVIIKMSDFPHGDKRGGTADKNVYSSLIQIRCLYKGLFSLGKGD
jgi:hypothetical protein